MKFSEFNLPLLLVPQNNSINLDVKSTGMEIKRHQGFLHRLLIDRGEGLNVKGGCVCVWRKACGAAESHVGQAERGRIVRVQPEGAVKICRNG